MSEKEQVPLVMPVFASEAEEAAWWYSQRDVLSERLAAKAAAGPLKRVRPLEQIAELGVRRAELALFQLEPEDAKKASALAAQRG